MAKAPRLWVERIFLCVLDFFPSAWLWNRSLRGGHRLLSFQFSTRDLTRYKVGCRSNSRLLQCKSRHKLCFPMDVTWSQRPRRADVLWGMQWFSLEDFQCARKGCECRNTDTSTQSIKNKSVFKMKNLFLGFCKNKIQCEEQKQEEYKLLSQHPQTIISQIYRSRSYRISRKIRRINQNKTAR